MKRGTLLFFPTHSKNTKVYRFYPKKLPISSPAPTNQLPVSSAAPTTQVSVSSAAPSTQPAVSCAAPSNQSLIGSGQAVSKHFFCSLKFPTHGTPSYLGGGESQLLLLDCDPLPQVASQALHDPHLPHPPFTGHGFLLQSFDSSAVPAQG